MKKILIMATAMIFAVGSTVMASNQAPVTKAQHPQKTTVPAKADVQKQAIKAEAKAPASETKASTSNSQQVPAKTQEMRKSENSSKPIMKDEANASNHKNLKKHMKSHVKK